MLTSARLNIYLLNHPGASQKRRHAILEAGSPVSIKEGDTGSESGMRIFTVKFFLERPFLDRITLSKLIYYLIYI